MLLYDTHAHYFTGKNSVSKFSYIKGLFSFVIMFSFILAKKSSNDFYLYLNRCGSRSKAPERSL